VKPGVPIRLLLAKPAKTVRVALARASGERLGRMRAARAVGGARLTWRAKLPRALSRRVDRLLVSIDYGGERVRLAVGLAPSCRVVR
jgi:hypothetical protein